MIMSSRNAVFGLAALTAAATIAGAAAAKEIVIGVVQVSGSTPVYIADEKGYFKELGLDVKVQSFASSSTMMPLLAHGDIQYVAGGVAANIFNAIAQGLDVKIVMSRASTPVSGGYLVRSAIASEIKTPADLKGRRIGTFAKGSIDNYLIAKVLAKGGLKMSDIELVAFGPPDQIGALATGALDVTYLPSPQSEVALGRKIATYWKSPNDFADPAPTEVAVVLENSAWADANRELSQKFMIALIKGARDYCNAFHGAPNRAEVAEITVRRANMPKKVVDDMIWSSVSPSGVINMASMIDIQKVFVELGQVQKPVDLQTIIDLQDVNAAVKKLGPYAAPADSKQEGCR